MKKLLLAAMTSMIVSATSAGAQDSASIAVTPPGTPINFFGLAIAKAADEVAGADLRLVPYKSTAQGTVVVNRGEVDFGLFNAIVLREAFEGREFYEGRAQTNLRTVARLMPIQITFSVPGGSDINSIADMKGKRFPAGFDATAFAERLYETMLMTEGLSYDDVEKVQVSGWAELGKAFIRGDLDVGGLVVGSATTTRYEQLVDGYRGISMRDDPETLAILQAEFPASRLTTVEPAEGLAGILEPTVVMEYDYWIYTHADASDEAVTKILTSLYEGQEVLAATSPDFRSFDPAMMNDDIGIPMHPAAEAFYAAQATQ